MAVVSKAEDLKAKKKAFTEGYSQHSRCSLDIATAFCKKYQVSLKGIDKKKRDVVDVALKFIENELKSTSMKSAPKSSGAADKDGNDTSDKAASSINPISSGSSASSSSKEKKKKKKSDDDTDQESDDGKSKDDKEYEKARKKLMNVVIKPNELSSLALEAVRPDCLSRALLYDNQVTSIRAIRNSPMAELRNKRGLCGEEKANLKALYRSIENYVPVVDGVSNEMRRMIDPASFNKMYEAMSLLHGFTLAFSVFSLFRGYTSKNSFSDYENLFKILMCALCTLRLLTASQKDDLLEMATGLTRTGWSWAIVCSATEILLTKFFFTDFGPASFVSAAAVAGAFGSVSSFGYSYSSSSSSSSSSSGGGSAFHTLFNRLTQGLEQTLKFSDELQDQRDILFPQNRDRERDRIHTPPWGNPNPPPPTPLQFRVPQPKGGGKGPKTLKMRCGTEVPYPTGFCWRFLEFGQYCRNKALCRGLELWPKEWACYEPAKWTILETHKQK